MLGKLPEYSEHLRKIFTELIYFELVGFYFIYYVLLQL